MFCCAQQVRGDPKQQAARQLTSKIVSQRKQTLQGMKDVRADPVRIMHILRDFCRQMLAYSSSPASNSFSYSASIHSTATVSSAVRAALPVGPTKSQQHKGDQLAVSCVLQLLQKVEAVLPQLRAQEAGNVLWACAKLSLNPDLAVPGLTARLISKVAEDEFAVAQNLSNTVWAVATLTDAGQLAPVDLAVVSTMFTRFMAFVSDPFTERSANSQEVANLLWAAATLELRLEVSALDRLCAHLVQLVQQPSTKAQVNEQVVANALWSFYKLRHSPEPARLSSLLAHFRSLFALQGRQPKLQAISNVVLAMAGLGFGQSSHVVEDLAHRLLITDRADLVSQDVCNVTWLAVNVLDTATFRLFWNIILSRFHGKVSTPDITQLYQALYKLQPPSYNLTWQQLRQQLTDALGPLPGRPSQLSPALHNVLQELQLEHRQDVTMSGYTADAVMRQKADSNSNILLSTLGPEDWITNVPNRCVL